MGCLNRTVNWFASYLSKRRQHVVINGNSSYRVHILAGATQGSILSPLLFLIYINILAKHNGCPMRLFADDTNFLTPICKLSMTGLLLGFSIFIP